MTILNYGRLTATVNATQIVDDVIESAPLTDVVITETFAGTTPSQILFPLSYKVDQNPPPGLTPKILVNGVKGLVVLGLPNTNCPEWGIVPLSSAIDALITGGAPPPGVGDTISLTYAYSPTGVIRVSDPAPEQAYKALANLGVFTGQNQQTSGTDLAAALVAAQSQLVQFSTPLMSIDAQVGEYYLGQGLDRGQQIRFTSNRLGFLGLLMLITAIQRAGSHGPQQKITGLNLEL